MSPTAEPDQWGPNLAELIKERAGGRSIRAFCAEVGIEHTRINAWGNGSTPTLEHLVNVARALGMSLPMLQVRIGVCAQSDLTAVVYNHDVANAIERDERLTPEARAYLRQTFEWVTTGELPRQGRATFQK